MSNIEKIKAEIERLKNKNAEWRERINSEDGYSYESDVCCGYDEAIEDFETFINSLPDENNPEPYNPVYDEDYLNEKIAKATKSWKGVDVDAMLAECRGYEEKPSEDLEKAANKYSILDEEGKWKDGGKYKGFIAGAEWMRKKDVEDMCMSDNRHFLKCYEQGKIDMKEQMMKDAVEGIAHPEECEIWVNLLGYGYKYNDGDKVRIIIVKED